MCFLYDTHVHTQDVSLCATSTATAQVRAFKQRGYTGIIITDHLFWGFHEFNGVPWHEIVRQYLSGSYFNEKLPWSERVRLFAKGYENAKKEGDACGLDVFLGWEFTPRAIKGSLDFLTYGLDIPFLLAHPNLLDMTLEEYSALVRRHKGYLAQAHPFRHYQTNLNRCALAPEIIDGIEVFNAARDVIMNKKAYEYAQAHNIPMQAGSDSHNTDYPSTPCGLTLGKRADSIHDIVDAICTGQLALVMPGMKHPI